MLIVRKSKTRGQCGAEMVGWAPLSPSNLHYCSNYCLCHPGCRSPGEAGLWIKITNHRSSFPSFGLDLLHSLKLTPLRPGWRPIFSRNHTRARAAPCHCSCCLPRPMEKVLPPPLNTSQFYTTFLLKPRLPLNLFCPLQNTSPLHSLKLCFS